MADLSAALRDWTVALDQSRMTSSLKPALAVELLKGSRRARGEPIPDRGLALPLQEVAYGMLRVQWRLHAKYRLRQEHHEIQQPMVTRVMGDLTALHAA